MVCINRYFYEEFYNELPSDAPDTKENRMKLTNSFWSSLHFVTLYFKACRETLTVRGSDIDAAIKEVFPDLVPYLVNLRCLRDLHVVPAVDATINLEDLSFHLDALLPTDWTSLHRTAELEERRRGLSLR